MKVQEEVKLLQDDLKVLNAMHKLAADLKSEHEVAKRCSLDLTKSHRRSTQPSAHVLKVLGGNWR